MIEMQQLFCLAHTQAADYLSTFRYPWEALDGIKQMILDLGEKSPVDEYEQRAEGVWYTRRRRYSRARISVHHVSSARRRRFVTVLLYEVPHS